MIFVFILLLTVILSLIVFINFVEIIDTCSSIHLAWPKNRLYSYIQLIEKCFQTTFKHICLYTLWDISFSIPTWILYNHPKDMSPVFKFIFSLFTPIVFSLRAHTFFYLGTKHPLSWNGTTVSHVWTHLRMFLNSKFGSDVQYLDEVDFNQEIRSILLFY
jgi:hypothetical protein